MSSLIPITEGEEQGLRLFKLLDEATNTLRQCLLATFATGPTSLQDELKKEEGKLRKILPEHQLDIVFPKSGDTDPEQYDISLLFVLLRTIRKIPRPKTGWKDEPLTTDQSVSANIVRIHLCRNKLLHGRLKKNQGEYTFYLDTIGASMVALGADIKIVKSIINQPIDGNVTALFNQNHNELEVANNEIKLLTDKLEDLEASYSKEVWYDVLPLTPLFTGRTDDVDEIHRLLSSKDNRRIATVITGLPGTGKTALALFYCYQYQQHYDNNVIWLNAYDNESLTQGFCNLARYLNILMQENDNSKIEMKQVISKVYKFFSNRNVLFVMDNADDVTHIVDFLPLNLPPTANKPSILLTSRVSFWGSQFHEKKVGLLTKQDTFDLIKNNLPTELIANQDLEKYYALLRGYPIAVQQGIAYMKYNMITIDEYLMEISDFGEENILSFPADDFTYQSNFYGSIMVTLSCLQLATNSKALEILHLISFMNGLSIDKKLFQNSNDFSQVELDTALMTLDRLSMIEIHRNFKKKEVLIKIHSLVQLVIRNAMMKTATHNTILNQLFSIFKETAKGKKIDHFEFGKPWIHHIVYLSTIIPDDTFVVEHLAIMLDDIVQALCNADRRDVALKILETIKTHQLSHSNTADGLLNSYFWELKILTEMRSCKKGLTICEEIHTLMLKTNTESSFGYFWIFKHKALCLSGLGKHEEALNIYRELHKQEIKLSGEFHKVTICMENDIACELSLMRKSEQSLKIYDKIIPIYESLPFYLDDSNYYQFVYNKGNDLMYLGRFSEAISTFQSILNGDAYKRRVELFGEENSSILRTKYRLASCFYELGFYNDSLLTAQSVEKLAKNSYEEWGYNRDILFTSQNIIANCLLRLGKYDDAFQKYKNLIEIGKGDSWCLSVKLNVAISLQLMSRLTVALDLYRSIIAGYERLEVEQSYTELWRTKINLASCLIDLGEYDESLQLLNAVLELKIFRDHDYYTIKIHTLLAECHQILGNYNESHTHCQHVFNLNAVSDWHSDRIKAKIIHAKNVMNRGQFSEVIAEMETLVKQSITPLGCSHPLIFLMKFIIATVIVKQGGQELDAIMVLKDLQCNQRQTIGEDHLDTLRTDFQLIMLTENDLEHKIRELQKVFEKFSGKLGSSHLQSMAVQKEIAICLIKQSKCDQAEPILRNIHKNMKQIYGKNHTELLETSKLLSHCVKNESKCIVA